VFIACNKDARAISAAASRTTTEGKIMMLVATCGMALFTLAASEAAAEEPWNAWAPRAFLIRSLVDAVPGYLESFHPDTGRFGSEPWICQDQNVLFPLAAAWAIEDSQNPYYHSAEVLNIIAKGGEALVDDMDDKGMWMFRKKDNSTWGPIHMPWTYSRWIRAYHLVGDALPEASRKRWQEGLLLGFGGIRAYMDGGVHNIPTHHAMGLYIAGVCFDRNEWKQAAAAFMAKSVGEQDPVGYWSEHYGPVVGYNEVYVDALGIYYHFSKDPVALEALQRSAKFHASVLWPDGSSVAAIDERQIYHKGIETGNVGFSCTPEGRGFLLKQVAAATDGGARNVSADYAAEMLLYGGVGDGIAPAADADKGLVTLGSNEAVIRRSKPWQWAFSGYACKPFDSRWIQDRQNLVDVYHDALGLVAGGGNTKVQPYWSTFTVGDPALLKHTPGDESPDFTPQLDLLWTPDEAAIANDEAGTRMDIRYGNVSCRVEACVADGALALTYAAPKGARVEAHLPLLNRALSFESANHQNIPLGEEDVVWPSAQFGGRFTYGGLEVTVPDGASLRWPARQHNPYKKDGSSELSAAKLVVCMPFDKRERYVLELKPAETPGEN